MKPGGQPAPDGGGGGCGVGRVAQEVEGRYVSFDWSVFTWIVPCLGGLEVLEVLSSRGMCPRCGASIWSLS